MTSEFIKPNLYLPYQAKTGTVTPDRAVYYLTKNLTDIGVRKILFAEHTVLKAPTVLLGLGLPMDNIHSQNENFDLKNFFGGIKASAIFLNEIAG